MLAASAREPLALMYPITSHSSMLSTHSCMYGADVHVTIEVWTERSPTSNRPLTSNLTTPSSRSYFPKLVFTVSRGMPSW